MERNAFEKVLRLGEGVSVEFKRCGDQPSKDTFETVCSFANRQGGNIYLGVLDDGTVEGVEVPASVGRNIVNVVSNPALFEPTPTVEVESIEYDGRFVVRVWVPSAEVPCRYKGEYFDRVADVDVRVKSPDQLSLMYVRKQNRYTERRVYPFLEPGDLRGDLIARARQMAVAHAVDHPWARMDDEELLRSARLYQRNRQTGEEGYTLAAILLFGSDDAILDVCPALRVDAVARYESGDRYDDRIQVRTNLLDSYDALVAFARRNSPDRFHLEGDVNVSLRDVIVRELVANMLIHREYSSPMPARLVVGPDAIRTQNASRSTFEGPITLADFNPVPKNPTIAHVFAQVGLAEELGSGFRNLSRCSLAYSGKPAALEDGDMFRAELPMPCGGRAGNILRGSEPSQTKVAKMPFETVVLGLLAQGGVLSASEAAHVAGCSLRTAQRKLKAMAQAGDVAMRETSGKKEYLSAGH